MDLAAYFRRIGYTEGGSDTERLFRVHLAHITHIPFENLDVYDGKEISVRAEDVFRKLVTDGRGGYCFEMNRLLCDALRAMGFPAYGVLARCSRGEGYSAHLHRMNLTEADGKRYVCDVGFGGDCFTEPLELTLGLEQERHGCVYRIVRGTQVQYSVQLRRDGVFSDLLGFDDIPALDEDFEVSSFYTNHSPASVFRSCLMLNRFTQTGRFSMFNLFLTTEDAGTVSRRAVSWEELPEVLNACFGLRTMPSHPPATPGFGA